MIRGLLAAIPILVIGGCSERYGTPPDDGQPSDGPEALMRAAAAGDVAEVRRRLEDGAEVDAQDRGGRTAVTAAVMGDHRETARVLRAAGADVDAQDVDRNNALLVCGETGNLEMLRVGLAAERICDARTASAGPP